MLTKSKIEQLLPIFENPYTDNELPIRQYCLKLRLLPRWKKSNTERAELNLAIP
jgi:hypothetical protein